MRNYTKIDKSNILINALFIQPTTYCNLNCKGCYVKEWETKQQTQEHSLSPALIAELAAIFSGQKKLPGVNCNANQITLAVDNSRFERLHMLYHKFNLMASPPRELNTEFHITINSLKTLNDYKIKNKKSDIDVISISNITRPVEVDIIREAFPKSTVNWNLQPGPVLPMNLFNIARKVDSIYLILHKPNTGRHLDPKVIKNYFDAYRILKKEFPEKVNVDGCIDDSKKFSMTGRGCSSNVSRFQIWPNGSVTGCPYNQATLPGTKFLTSDMFISEQVISILDNIQNAHQYYEFNNCKIPEDLYPESPHALKRSNHFPIIE